MVTAVAASWVASVVPVASVAAVPAPIAAAVADAHRPAADRARDALRKPAACIAFAGLKPGDQVGELLPGEGYFTRIFSGVVGPRGHVYAVAPPPGPSGRDYQAGARKLADDPHYRNVTILDERLADLKFPQPLDLVWTSQNYHDLHNIPHFDVVAFDRRVFAALKPGGIFLVLDHAAAAGSGTRDTDTLHRIDPAVVKREVLAAGFELVGQSNLLHRPQDPHTAAVFAPSIRGRTDQFIFKFRKPTTAH
ncbi:MAG: class I SAM-dependent methyltransferase [Gammaproteobacteria bacterium]|nr:class I SAM-dependent methyltransferase [Gammaproteobacteria bacterium]